MPTLRTVSTQTVFSHFCGGKVLYTSLSQKKKKRISPVFKTHTGMNCWKAKVKISQLSEPFPGLQSTWDIIIAQMLAERERDGDCMYVNVLPLKYFFL